jgi:hypothetical protein
MEEHPHDSKKERPPTGAKGVPRRGFDLPCEYR